MSNPKQEAAKKSWETKQEKQEKRKIASQMGVEAKNPKRQQK